MSSNIEPRIKTVEEAMQTLKQLTVKANERKDAHKSWSSEFARARVRLAHAQSELSAAQARTEAVVAKTGERLNALIDVVERFTSGQSGK